MKQKLSAFVVLIILLVLSVGCGSKPYETATENFLKAYQGKDIDGAEQFIDKPDKTYSNLFALKDSDKQLFGEAFSHLEYEIVESKLEKDKAEVVVNIKAKNLGQVNELFIAEIYRLALEEKKDGFEIEKMMGDLYLKFLNQADIKMTETKTTIHLTKKSNQWLIIPDFELRDAITGGLYKAYGNGQVNEVK